MRVIIINPPTYHGIKFVREGRCEQRGSSFQYVMVPISLPCVGAVLRRGGHEVRIVDCIADDLSTQELLESFEEFSPNLAIFDVSTPTISHDKEVIELIKQHHPKCHLTAIGTHVTALPEQVLSSSELDSVIRGEPELTGLELANTLEREEDVAQVEGISFKKKREVSSNPDRPFIEDLNSLPFPARDLIHNEKYTMPVSNRPYTLLVSSRGCTGRCIFCTAHLYYGRKLRLRSADNICDELEEIVEKFDIKDVTMWSDTFTLNRDFVVSVCKETIRRGLKVNWMTNSRVDKVDLELLKLMKSAGCSMISYGVESAVPEILRNCKKGTTPQQIQNAFKWSRQAGLETICHVILGLPGETKETIKQTVNFIKKIKPDYAQFYGAIPFPGTEFYDMAIDNKWLATDDWSCFEINQAIVSYPQLSAEELNRERRRAFRAFYFRPGYVLKRLAKLKTWREWVNLPGQAWSFLKEWVGSKNAGRRSNSSL